MYLLLAPKNELLFFCRFSQFYLFTIHCFSECGLRLSISIGWVWGLCFPISTKFNILEKTLPYFVLVDRAWYVCVRDDYSVSHVSTRFPDFSSSRDGLGTAFPGYLPSYLPIQCFAEKKSSLFLATA